MTQNTQPKIALITGVMGQDGIYLTQLLLSKGYIVHGVKRPTEWTTNRSSDNVELPEFATNMRSEQGGFFIHHADITDEAHLLKIIAQTRPNEIYNLAAQSHVQVSFEKPKHTTLVDALGPLYILDGIRTLGLENHTRYYQASSCELFGRALVSPQNEKTPFYPRNPYAISKLYAYWLTVNYREAYGMYACNGILFNHESPYRGETFVTRKITRALARIQMGLQDCLYLGNLDARRDWGHARDYVEAQWLMLQQDEARDYVIATGVQHSVRDFIDLCCKILGLELRWQGNGLDERAIDSSGQTRIAIDPRYFRPAEVDGLIGDARLAQKDLGWMPHTSFEDLVSEMVSSDLIKAQQEKLAIG